MRAKHLLLFVMLLAIAGCNYPSVSFVSSKKIPPPFSLLADPNNASPSYLKRIEKYNDILKSSPVPIFVMDQDDLPEKLKEFLKLPVLGILHGVYVANSKDKEMPNKFIFINNRNSPEATVVTFFHEYQHYLCEKKGCYCISDNHLPKDEKMLYSILREKHALENELRQSLKLKDPYLISNSFVSLTNYILYNKECIYKLAAVMMVDGKLWNQATKFIVEQEGKIKKVR